MLRVSTRGEYGVRLMVYLARHYGAAPSSLTEISLSEGLELQQQYLEQLVRALRQEGVGELFTLPGGHLDAIYAACSRHEIRVLDTRHEQAAAHMDLGWGPTTGRACVARGDGGAGPGRPGRPRRRRVSSIRRRTAGSNT